MFGPFKQEATNLDTLIVKVEHDMQACGPTGEDYPELLEHLERLNKMRAAQKPAPISRDNMILVAGNILGILAIVAYEQKHVMVSKAQTLILRPNTPR